MSLSIQATIAAAARDTILVAEGTYRESRVWAGKVLALQGAGAGQSVVDPSAAKGGPGGRCLYTENLTAGSHVEGFTFQGGQSSSGGMINYRSSPTLTNCILWGNSASYGGGMYNNP